MATKTTKAPAKRFASSEVSENGALKSEKITIHAKYEAGSKTRYNNGFDLFTWLEDILGDSTYDYNLKYAIEAEEVSSDAVDAAIKNGK